MTTKSSLRKRLPRVRNLATSFWKNSSGANRPTTPDRVSRGEITELFGNDLDPDRLDSTDVPETKNGETV